MIRPINQDDRELFLSLTAEFFASDAVLFNVPHSYHAAAFDELMSAASLQLGYMLCSGEQAVGYALLSKKYSHEAGGVELWLEELYVREAYRNRGLGREFLDMFVSGTLGDHTRLRLETEPENSRANALYRSCGFQSLPYDQMILNMR